MIKYGRFLEILFLIILTYTLDSCLGVLRQTVKPGTPPDFILKVTIDRHPVRFFVHKRPHVDFFLNIVSLIDCLNYFMKTWTVFGTPTNTHGSSVYNN